MKKPNLRAVIRSVKDNHSKQRRIEFFDQNLSVCICVHSPKNWRLYLRFRVMPAMLSKTFYREGVEGINILSEVHCVHFVIDKTPLSQPGSSLSPFGLRSYMLRTFFNS